MMTDLSRHRLRTLLVFWLALGLPTVLSAAPAARPVRNVIILIGDGMGINTMAQAHYHQFGQMAAGKFARLAMESLPVCGIAYTDCENELVPDSAATATALWTGRKALAGSLGVGPDGKPTPTLFEQAAGQGKAVGFVTTVPITHATPAAGYAHVPKRDRYHDIFTWLLKARPDVVFGAGADTKGAYLPADFAGRAQQAGYTVARTRNDLFSLTRTPALGVFAGDRLPFEWDRKSTPSPEPDLTQMAGKALDLLAKSPKGFVLMVESGMIDYGNHENSVGKAVEETLALDRCVDLVCRWVEKNSAWDETLLIVTADHETGEVSVRSPHQSTDEASKRNSRTVSAGQYAGVAYNNTYHSAAPVVVFAKGRYAEALGGVMDNTHIYEVARNALGLRAAAAAPPARP